MALFVPGDIATVALHSLSPLCTSRRMCPLGVPECKSRASSERLAKPPGEGFLPHALLVDVDMSSCRSLFPFWFAPRPFCAMRRCRWDNPEPT